MVIGDISNLAVNAYLAMMKLCTPLHGEGAGAIHLVLKSMLPGILMVGWLFAINQQIAKK